MKTALVPLDLSVVIDIYKCFPPNHTSTLWSTVSPHYPVHHLVVLPGLGGIGGGLVLALDADGAVGHEVAADGVGSSGQGETNDDTWLRQQ